MVHVTSRQQRCSRSSLMLLSQDACTMCCAGRVIWRRRRAESDARRWSRSGQQSAVRQASHMPPKSGAYSAPEIAASDLEALWALEGSVRAISAPGMEATQLASEAKHAGGLCLQQLFEAQAGADGNASCLVQANGGVALSYAEVGASCTSLSDTSHQHARRTQDPSLAASKAASNPQLALQIFFNAAF